LIRPRRSRSLLACWAWIPAVVPERKNRSRPLCRKLRIATPEVYHVTYQVTTRLSPPNPGRPSSPVQAARPERGGVAGAPDTAVKRKLKEGIKGCWRASRRPLADGGPARGARPRRGYGELMTRQWHSPPRTSLDARI
jgi:hypothetical protein